MRTIIVIRIFTFFALVQAEQSRLKRVTAEPEALEAKPFAEHYVVFHISTGDLFTQNLVLNNAQNLLKHYGTDNVAIEIVAFGQGLRLFFKENEQAKRIKSLADSGIKFFAKTL